MAPDWARVNDVFHRALEQPVDSRPAFLDTACAGDEALRREVASLLAASNRAGGFIERPAVPPGLLREGPAPPDPLVGRDVGQYRVQRVLGEGGMGIVYLAEDTRLGRPVALKALAPRFTSDAGGRARMAREARAAGGLTHPGIATVYTLEEFDDRLYIACEYVPGDTLRVELERGPLSPARVVDTALSLARALAVAHERGVVHRDLKPENVIRTPGGDLKILDFGLARFRDAPAAAPALTGDGMILGTPAYMSPEQIRGTAVDGRSDVFSLGIVLYELATGVHPFAGRDAASTIAKILESEPARLTAPSADRTSTSVSLGQLESLVMTCLRKPADAQYGSARDLIAALEQMRATPSPIDMVPAAVSEAGLARGGSSRRTPRWWWEFHQTAAGAAYLALLTPLWLVHTWTPGLTGLMLFLIGLAAAIVAGTLRMHLLFTVRSYPAEREQQQHTINPWMRRADFAFAGVLLVDSAVVLTLHASVAAILVAAAVAVVLSSTVIEPATTRAAFNEGQRPKG